MVHNPTLWMLVGVPGSGKSTWVTIHIPDLTGHYVASTDRLIEIYASMRQATYNDVFKDNIGYAEKAMLTHVKDAIMYNYNIIWDQTNLTIKSRAKKLALIPDYYKKIAVFFPTPETGELDRRLASRPGKTIPSYIVDNMIDSLMPPTISEGFDEVYTNV
jgi:predicted kinase